MLKYAAITSMNKTYYDNIGRNMLRSYKAHWNEILPLYVYNEDGFEIKVKTVHSMGWNLPEDYKKFQVRHDNRRIQQFSKKAYSVLHAMEWLKTERLMWIDADCMITRPIPRQMLELVAPADVLSTHFGVYHDWPSDEDPNRVSFSCETGFFVLNKKHPMFERFKEVYADLYNNDGGLRLRRFYDGEVYGETVRILEQEGAKMLDLNPGGHKTPMSRSVMSPYLQHFKSSLKNRIDQSAFEVEFAEDDEE